MADPYAQYVTKGGKPKTWEKERAGIGRVFGGLPRGIAALAKDIYRLSKPEVAATFLPGGTKPREEIPALAAVIPETAKSLVRTQKGISELIGPGLPQIIESIRTKKLPQVPALLPGGIKPKETSIPRQARETTGTETAVEHLLNILGVVSAGATVGTKGLKVAAGAAKTPQQAARLTALAEGLQPLRTPLRTLLRESGAGAKRAAVRQLETAVADISPGLKNRFMAPVGRAVLAGEFKQQIKNFLRPVVSAQVEGAIAPHVLAMRSAQSRLMNLKPPELQKLPWKQRRDAASAMVGREIAEKLQGVQFADELAGEMFPTVKKVSLPDDPELHKWMGRAEELAREDAAKRLREIGLTAEPMFVPRTTKKALRKAHGKGGAFERARRLEAEAQGLREEVLSPFEARFRTAPETASVGAQIIKLQARAAEEWALGKRWMDKAFEAFEGIEKVPEARVPAVWQPMFTAVKNLREGIRTSVEGGILSPTEAQALLGNVPSSLSELMDRAAAAGINPAHISDIRPSQVRRLVYGNVDLGRPPIQEVGKTIEGRFRKTRTGQLRKLDLDEKSVETFIAQHVDMMHEAQSNALADLTLKEFARAIPETVPDHVAKYWQPWSPIQPAGPWEKIMVEGRRVAVPPPNAEYMIPRSVGRAIKNHTFREPPTGFLSAVDKITNSWRYLVLNLSPRWYANNIIGNVLLATLEGVRLQDWVRSWQALRKTEVEGQKVRGVKLPERVRPLKGAELPEQIPGVLRKSSIQQEFDSSLGALAQKVGLPREGLARANSIVDELARTAVLMKSLRKGMTVEQATTQALKALVDYGDLSTLERSVIRRVVPFWSWQKGMFKLVGRLPADHPLRAVAMQKLSSLLGGYTEEERRTFPDYLFASVPLSGGRQLATRGMNPFQDALSVSTPEGLVQSINPAFELPLRALFNVPEAGFSKRVTVSPTGIAEPDVNIRGALQALIQELPLARAATGDIPEKRQFFGLTIREREQIEKALARTAKARARQAQQQSGGSSDPYAQYVK